jgi:hypothetical protein
MFSPQRQGDEGLVESSSYSSPKVDVTVETVATSFYMSTTAGCCYPMVKLGHPTMATVHKKFADANLIRCLGRVLQAAFLYVGFVCYSVQPPFGHIQRQSSESGTLLCLCRWYTASQLVHREDAEVAVQMVCAAQGSGDIMLVMFITKASITFESFLLSIRACRAVVSTSLV